jgi:hypothetical protein
MFRMLDVAIARSAKQQGFAAQAAMFAVAKLRTRKKPHPTALRQQPKVPNGIAVARIPKQFKISRRILMLIVIRAGYKNSNQPAG